MAKLGFKMKCKLRLTFCILIILTILLLTPFQVCSASTGWSQTYQGTGYPSIGFTQTNDGGYAITGWAGQAKIGSTNNDAILIKTDSFGNKTWGKTYGGPLNDGTNTVIATKDGGFALLGYLSDGVGHSKIWLIKTDSSGELQWNKTLAEGLGNSLVQTSDEGYAIAGFIPNGFLFLKTDSLGNVQFTNVLGNIPIQGTWKVSNEASSIAQTLDGGFIIAGQGESQSNSSDRDVWLFKTDASGNALWNQKIGGTQYDGASQVIQTSDGGYALVGYTFSYGNGKNDVWLVKLDSSGSTQWDKTFGGSEDDFGSGLVQTSDGGYALIANTKSFGTGGQDFWLLKVDSFGNKVWDQTYGGAKDEGAGSLVLTEDGGYALAGYSDSFGNGQKNFWLVKTDASGVVPEFSTLVWLSIIVLFTTALVYYKFRRSGKIPIRNYGR